MAISLTTNGSFFVQLSRFPTNTSFTYLHLQRLSLSAARSDFDLSALAPLGQGGLSLWCLYVSVVVLIVLIK
jgi:hypothetical protein